MSLNRQSNFPIFQAYDFFEVTPSDTLELVSDPANRTGALRTVTIARTDNVATVTDNGHPFKTGDRIVFRGATQTEYNGIKTITVTGANTYTFLVKGDPTTPATGTIQVNKVNYERAMSIFISSEDNEPCDVSVVSPEGKTATFNNVPSGTFLPILVKQVRTTNTSADKIIALIGN